MQVFLVHLRKSLSRNRIFVKMSRDAWVIDCDPGVDDAMAIILALNHKPAINVVGITTVKGNVSARQSAANTYRILRLLKRTEIPVYAGCESPLVPIDKYHASTYYHGEDGLGDKPDAEPKASLKDFEAIQTEHAANALVKLSEKYAENLRLLVLGPMTNIAMAIRLDPHFCTNVKSLHFMGGNMHAIGNTPTPTAEFNFYHDPEAAWIMLQSMKCTITCIPWETYLTHKIEWDFYERFANANGTEIQRFRHAIGAKGADYMLTGGIASTLNVGFCDEAAVAVALRPDMVEESHHVYATVELAGRFTRGQLVCDWAKKTWMEPNLHIVSKYNLEKMERLVMEAVLQKM